MVDFAGWDMPVQYNSIVAEHHAVRKAAGLFDIAHMGRLKFTGPDAAKFLEYLVTNDVASLAVGQIKYALVTNEEGGILDDVLVYRLGDGLMLVVNASNRLKIVGWIERHRGKFAVTVEDQTLTHFMAALQGPLGSFRCSHRWLTSICQPSEVLLRDAGHGSRPTGLREPHGVHRRGWC